MTLRFDGQVAIVTGSGGGLGRAYARSLAQRGASVVVHDIAEVVDAQGHRRRATDLVVEEIVAGGGSAIACHEDIASAEAPRRIVEAAIHAYGRIDIVINNAGIARHKPFADQTRAELDAILATHVDGGFLVTQAAFAHMRAAGYGRILFTASSAAAFGMPDASAYAAAKGGVLGLMKVLALEGAAHGVRCNALLPGAFTGMAPRLTGPVPPGFESLYRACARVEGRFTPEFVVPLVNFLVSPGCEVTGEIYAAQAGHYARVVMVKGGGWTAPSEGPPTDADIQRHFSQIRDCTHWFVPADAIDDLNITGDALDVVRAASGGG